jgi:hypothetical protein
VVNRGFRDFEQSVVRSIRDRNLDGVVCGHIHAAAIREVDGVTYINCGDWVDSCTGIVEHGDGRMEIVHWGVSAAHAAPQGDPALGSGVQAGASEPPRIAA